MEDSANAAERPLIVVASRDDWSARSLGSALSTHGYTVIPTPRGREVVTLARRTQPDAIILDLDLEDPDALTICRGLREVPEITLATPIILSTAGPAIRQQRLDALRAGAWHLRAGPIDAEEFVQQLTVFVRAKRDADRIGDEGLVDRGTGLYNRLGLARRARELNAQARRQGVSLACVVFALDGAHLTELDAATRLAQALRDGGRMSDAIGRAGPAEFAIFAPTSDVRSAERLAERLWASVQRALPESGQRVRHAHRVAPMPLPAAYDPLDLLHQALDGVRGTGPPES
jgi:DNA-binding response OmpR family regulator